jgi:hypothetical protein
MALGRLIVKIKRDLCDSVSHAIKTMSFSGKDVLHVHQRRWAIDIGHGLVLWIHFAFFISVGYVHMVEPVVRHQLV